MSFDLCLPATRFSDSMDGLTTSEYWSERHQSVLDSVFDDRPHNIEYLYPTLDKYLAQLTGARLFEFGCVPGQGLLKVCRRYGLIPSGSDFVAEVQLVGAVIQKEYPNSKFFRHDLSREDVARLGQYDVVMSLGLIEHFADVEKVLSKHVQTTRPGGLLILSTPNLNWIRSTFWRIVDPQLWRAHNPEATNLRRISKLLESNSCKVLEAGYFGNPHFWTENRGRRAAASLNFLIRNLGLRNTATFPFVYWIARRMTEEPDRSDAQVREIER